MFIPSVVPSTFPQVEVMGRCAESKKNNSKEKKDGKIAKTRTRQKTSPKDGALKR